MVGTQVAYRAVSSWETALKERAVRAGVLLHGDDGERGHHPADRRGFRGRGSGLAFTTIPIGSEDTRDGRQPPTLPAILYAPVAVTAVDFGFNINQAGQVTTPLKLTPSLLAKALTQVYKSDLPDYYPDFSLPGPTWRGQPAQHHERTRRSRRSTRKHDVQLHRLGLPADHRRPVGGQPAGLAVDPVGRGDGLLARRRDGPRQHGDRRSRLRRAQDWASRPRPTSSTRPTRARSPALRSSRTSSSCGGPPDLANPTSNSCVIPTGDKANPNTKARLVLNSEDLLPVEPNFDQAAAAVLAASDTGLTNRWDTTAKAADGSSGWFYFGRHRTARANLHVDRERHARPGRLRAGLRLPVPTRPRATCVQPSTDSVAAALGTATADSAACCRSTRPRRPRPGLPAG